jgi:hypothetical protein
MAHARPKSVLEMILAWSEGRPVWQQDPLRRIVANGAVDAKGIADMVKLCKKGCGATDIDLNADPLTTAHVPTATAADGHLVLTSISKVAGVNRLAPGQTLPFETSGITVIYGDNGAGKSGYARILKRACRADIRAKSCPMRSSRRWRPRLLWQPSTACSAA